MQETGHGVLAKRGTIIGDQPLAAGHTSVDAYSERILETARCTQPLPLPLHVHTHTHTHTLIHCTVG